MRYASQHGSLVITPLAAPQLGGCAFSGRGWRLCAARHSQGGPRPAGPQPPPRGARASCLQVCPISLEIYGRVLPYRLRRGGRERDFRRRDAQKHGHGGSALGYACITPLAAFPSYHPPGSAPARPLRLLRPRLAAPCCAALPGWAPATGASATASAARVSRRQSRPFHCSSEPPPKSAVSLPGVIHLLSPSRREIDFDDVSITENTRCAYPLQASVRGRGRCSR